jgi:hypothetical protein
MSGDEPSLEPARGLSPLGTNILIGTLAFAGGIAGTALMLQLSGGSLQRTPAPQVASSPQPQPSPVALPPGTDLASLSAREQALATRLDQLETRLRDVDGGARTAASYATQAERLMIAFAVRRAIERGLPLGTLETQLRRRFGEAHGDAVATIIGAAREPVTLEDLRLALDLIAPRLGSSPRDGLWTSVRRALGDMVVLRQGESPSSRPADRLKRARRTLEEGQVEAALAEVAHLPGADSASSWVTAAKRYIAARAALREIEAAAMETPAAQQPRAGA